MCDHVFANYIDSTFPGAEDKFANDFPSLWYGERAARSLV